MEMTREQNLALVGAARERLAWPTFPELSTTLLAAFGAVVLFLGLGALTAQGWMTWLGIGVAAGILAYHALRHREARERRATTRDLLNARLISHCRSTGLSSLLPQLYGGVDRIVLLLTDDALHISIDDNPLDIFTTVPLYEIVEVGPGTVESDLQLRQPEASQDQSFSLALRIGGKRLCRLSFSHFEEEAPAALWVDSLRRALIPRECSSTD